MATAFQPSAFQNNAFQIETGLPTVVICDLGAALNSTTITVEIRCHG
jgi:hypothetical protein